MRTVYVAPVYPDLARAGASAAIVILECTIDPSGRVDRRRASSPAIPCSTTSAIDAVRQWRYTPTRLNGVPVAVLMTVTVRFSPTDEQPDGLPRPTAEPNVTPLIDVMLVLLILFMLVTPVAQRGLDAALPAPPQADGGRDRRHR